VIRYTPNDPPRVLFLRGLWAEWFRVEESLRNVAYNSQLKTGWLRSSPVGLGFSYWPADYPEILSFDLIVLGNVPAQPFDLVGQEMLADYVKGGGNLLILGGDRAFGQAGFENRNFLDVLPVEPGGPYNWRPVEDGGRLAGAGSHAILEGVAFAGIERVFYSHLSKPRDGAVVVATVGSRPFLVVGETAEGGRIACVLGTPFGEAGNGEAAFWDAPAYVRLMQNTIKWLLRR
jgi:uncharacterized membrane protein